MLFRGVAQPGSAPALGAGSPRFESGRPDHLPPAFGMSLLLKTASALGLTVILTMFVATASQDAPYMTVQNGVYTSLQAEKGAAHYERHCQTCHGVNLTGANARALAGEEFLKFWMGLTLDHMFSRLQSMPPGDMNRLDATTYIELLAYLLSANDLPAGTEPLAVDILADVMIEGKDGPQPVVEFALVQVVGCLSRTVTDNWFVTDASEPLRTRDPAPSIDDARTVATSIQLGDNSFELLYVYPNPDNFEGHRVETKGFLIRGEQDQINVTAIQSLNPDCQ
tara:strand:+ start:21448 stop:22290 length:843 start_codon:yes stop_codon:yes gene_type:complete